MPRLGERARFRRIFPDHSEEIWIRQAPLHVASEMINAQNALQIFDFIIPCVLVLVVDVVAIGDWSTVKLPDRAMEE